MVEKIYVCLVESIGGVEKNCETSSTFVMHGNMWNVESTHMQIFATKFVKVEVM
jgi:hypothetical protein